MFSSKEKLLSAVQLKRLGEHKYKCDSCSVLDPYLQVYWNWLVSKVPIWLAPNLITVLGLLVNILTTLILVWFSPDAKSEAPQWSFLLCALGLFVYQSLDAIDGKQARRTDSSTPLGELFDHGCDSISTVFVAVSACVAIQLGNNPSMMFFQCFCAVILFYCAHWQTYVSGMLRFGRIDVTEAQFTIIFVHLVSAVFGSDIWLSKYNGGWCEYRSARSSVNQMRSMASLCVSLLLLYHNIRQWQVGYLDFLQLRYGTIFMTAVCATLSLVKIFTVVFTGGIGKNGSTVALPWVIMQLKMLPGVVGICLAAYLLHSNMTVIFTGGVGKNGSSVAGTSVLSPIIPLSLVVVPAFIIWKKSEQNLYEDHPVLYIFAFGLVASKVTNRLVVAHMTKHEMDYFDSSMFGPAMLFLNQYFNFFIPEYYVLWLCIVWVALDLLLYSARICKEICDYLHIELFRIPLKDSLSHHTTKNGTQVNTVSSNVEKGAGRTSRSKRHHH